MHLDKACEFASVNEISDHIEKVSQCPPDRHPVYTIFLNIYHDAGNALFAREPELAIQLQQKALTIPNANDAWYGFIHLVLAIEYDDLLQPQKSLDHALEALKNKSLEQMQRNRALGFASLGSGSVGKPEDCFAYFAQITNLNDLTTEESFLILSTVGICHFNQKNWEEAINYREKASKVFPSSSPQALLAKYNLATTYGQQKRKDEELKLYQEILLQIQKTKQQTLDRKWLFELSLMEMAINISLQENEAAKESKKERERQKPSCRQRLVAEAKRAQADALAREEKWKEEKKKKREDEKRRAEARKAQISSPSSSSSPESYPLELDKPKEKTDSPKVKEKTRGVAAPAAAPAEMIREVPLVAPIFPALGTTAQAVFQLIEDENWTFSRKDYEHYLTDLGCIKHIKGSHQVYQLPKTLTISLEKEGNKVEQTLFLPDHDVQLGSVTLPPWDKDYVPHYLVKHLRAFHEKIVGLYTKLASIKEKE